MIEHNQPAREPLAAVEPAPTAGIDWASQDHAVAIVDAHGVQVERFTISHTTPGLRRLVHRLRRAGVCEVAIERPDGPVVDALLEAELGVIVIAPNQMKNLRGRYGSAGNKDDSFDAYVALVTPKGSPERRNFVNCITTNVTAFFREGHHFTFL